MDIEAARRCWYPIAASSDLPFRHVFHAQLWGRELAVWRADDGNVNAWENRCLHRGVRLSIGINDGTELVCQYHGWRYANRTAGCTYIPAHPADAPARTICNNVYPVQERYGLVWCGDSPEGSLPSSVTEVAANTATITLLKAVTFHAPAATVIQALKDEIRTWVSARELAESTAYALTDDEPYHLTFRAQTESEPDIIFFTQPQDAQRTTIRGLLCGVDNQTTEDAALTRMLRHFSHRLNQCRDRTEALHQRAPALPPWIPIIPVVSEANASLPPLSNDGRSAALRVRVAAIIDVAQQVKSFVLEPIDSTLPAAQPGAHIDVHLPNGLIRQYSLINGPGQTGNYTIAVKHLADSSGGSITLHTTIRQGDVLATSVPRNNFTLRRDAEQTILIAGGIGITPLLSMARALNHTGLPFTLHYFVASESDIVFRDELLAMSGTIEFYFGQSVEATTQSLNTLLNTPATNHHVYLCGPGPMLTLARDIAATRQWPDESIHFEYFKNTEKLDNSSAFSVELARSGLTLTVPAGVSLLQVLRDNNVAVPSSCEQGACGTCRVDVLEGTPEHQDVYLSDVDKLRGNCMMSCVSRARTSTLVLDL